MLRLVPSRRSAMSTCRKAGVGVTAVVAGIVGVANYSTRCVAMLRAMPESQRVCSSECVM